jgi:hypothetical protein
LIQLGVDFQHKKKFVRWEDTKRALEVFKSLNRGVLAVPSQFVVPRSKDWPEELHGMRLGQISCRIRNMVLFQDKRDELIKMGFDYRSSSRIKWDRVRAALVAYHGHFGDFMVPYKFVVPRNSHWPQATWDMKLGNLVARIRMQKIFVNNYGELARMGFRFAGPGKGRGRRIGLTAAAALTVTSTAPA